jgi:hypothetical protein
MMSPIEAAIRVSLTSMLVLCTLAAAVYLGLCIVETWGGGL